MTALVELDAGVRRALAVALEARDPRPVRWFLTDVAPRAVSSVLAGLLSRGTDVADLRLLRTKVKPSRRFSVEADVVLDTGHVRRIWVVWSRPGGGPSLPPVHPASWSGLEAVLAPFDRPAAVTPDGALVLLVAPFDPVFPQLVRLHDAGYLTARVPGHEGYGSSTVVPVRYRPGQRHVLLLSTGAASDGGVYVKAYRDASGERSVRLGRESATVLAGGDHARAVAPIAWLDDDRIALWPAVSGAALSTEVGSEAAAAASHVDAAGRALRALHDAAPSAEVSAQRHGLAGEVAGTLRAGEVVEGLAPTTGRRLREGVHAAAARVAACGGEDDCRTHGDYKCANILVGDGTVHVLDFDRGALADPALDLGKMLADLWWWAPHAAAAERLQASLIAGYEAAHGSSRSRLDRARAYEALFLLRIAARRAPVHEPGWAETVERAVAKALAGARAGAA